MKKVLFATTALVASAGIAAAEIEFGLSAEMGITGGDFYGANDEAQFHNDFTISVDGSGETDGGMTFGFHVEIEESNGGGATNGSASYDNESVFISGAFGTLTLGEIDGAYDRRLKEVAFVGSIADDETIHTGFNGNSGFDGVEDNQILRYDYSFGDFGFSVSMEQDDNGAGDDDIYAVGVSYDFAMASGIEIGFGLGYTSKDNNGEIIGASLYADTGNGFEAGLNASSYDSDFAGADWTHYAIGMAYTWDAFSIGANYGKYDLDSGSDVDGFGLAANYDLGGGAVVQFGYGDGEDRESYSLGIAMSF
ncbi:outer membrane protein OmpU [Rhodovulum iodosum]|uniref:Outer membrane protein OmpU n=1 Tax=Rhodovulum iodosum TaxID=68291 RepID=A0ABV3XRY9_9RHOB|nr:porin [Rhodovulum robiginosum]RSK30429.1 porin [Rhodovulum robiginosum]